MSTQDKEIEALAMRMLESALAAPDALWPIEAKEARQNWHSARQAASLIIQARDESRTPPAEHSAPALPTDLKTLSEKIAANLFSDLYGRRVDRLVLTYDNPPKNMGGLCFGAARDRVLDVLNAEKLTPALPTDRMGWLEMRLRCEHALKIEGGVLDPDDEEVCHFLFPASWPMRIEVTHAELTRLQSLAAELLAEAKDGGA